MVIGGTSAEHTLRTAKYASAHYLDHLPTSGSEAGHGFRDLDWEQQILEMTRGFGIGAQFGGKYFCHDVRVVRLPRHGASNPVGIAVSCSADRQALGKITSDGVFLEQLEEDPARFLPEITDEDLSATVVPGDAVTFHTTPVTGDSNSIRAIGGVHHRRHPDATMGQCSLPEGRMGLPVRP